MGSKIDEIYGNRLRLRVVGLCWKEDKLVMVNHQGLGTGDFWAPPGGGVDFGTPAEEALEKEFLEETGLKVRVDDFLFACELIKPPLHGVELFFSCTLVDGMLVRGHDPEMSPDEQIISDVRYLGFDELARLEADRKHGIFSRFTDPQSLKMASGYFKI